MGGGGQADAAGVAQVRGGCGLRTQGFAQNTAVKQCPPRSEGEQVPHCAGQRNTAAGVLWGSYMMKDYKVLADGLRQVLEWAGQGRLTLQVSHR